MKTIALIASCLASIVFSNELSWKKEFTLTEFELLHLPKIFSEWSNAFEKVYKTDDEKVHRFQIWLENLKKIADHNSKDDKTFTMRLNQFGDLTSDEFLHYVHGGDGACYAKKDGIRKLSSLSSKTISSTNKLGANPTTVDWTSKGVVTPVKNQGQCGSCWAFSATGSTEAAIAISTGKLNSLSEQQLVDCSKENHGCNGGEMDLAFKYIESNGGLCSESEYPYTGKDGECKSTSCGTKYDAIKSYADVTVDNEADLETATVTQPQSVAVEADQSTFQFYSKGTVMTGNCGTQTDHGVLIVGYNNEASTKYWIVKNSWGVTWGDEGYCYICKDCDKNGDKGECGINTDPSHPIA